MSVEFSVDSSLSVCVSLETSVCVSVGEFLHFICRILSLRDASRATSVHSLTVL